MEHWMIHTAYFFAGVAFAWVPVLCAALLGIADAHDLRRDR